MNSYVDPNYQMRQYDNSGDRKVMAAGAQQKYKIKMVGSSQNTRGTNSQY